MTVRLILFCRGKDGKQLQSSPLKIEMNAEPNAALTYSVYAPPSDEVTSIKLIDQRKRFDIDALWMYGIICVIIYYKNYKFM